MKSSEFTRLSVETPVPRRGHGRIDPRVLQLLLDASQSPRRRMRQARHALEARIGDGPARWTAPRRVLQRLWYSEQARAVVASLLFWGLLVLALYGIVRGE